VTFASGEIGMSPAVSDELARSTVTMGPAVETSCGAAIPTSLRT